MQSSNHPTVPESNPPSRLRDVLTDLAPGAKPSVVLQRYSAMAAGYDTTCGRIISIRARATNALALRAGETVADVACGTGATLTAVAATVGGTGRALGIELCPAMAAQAAFRVEHAGVGGWTEVLVSPVETFATDCRFDALLFCYTHDVFQSEEALTNLFRHAKPGARVSVAGMRFLPWWWGFGHNLFTGYRARNYLSTFHGLREPWHLLKRWCPDFRVIHTEHAGTSYHGVGTVSRLSS